jgi:hypothetical protein
MRIEARLMKAKAEADGVPADAVEYPRRSFTRGTPRGLFGSIDLMTIAYGH